MTVLPRESRCVGCGYSLQGLPPNGVCPECGSAYSPPVHHPALIDDAVWRHRLLIGAAISLWSTVALMAAIVAAVCVAAASPDRAGPVWHATAMGSRSRS